MKRFGHFVECLEVRRLLTRAVPLIAPGNLVETNPSESSIALAWSDNSRNEIGFRIDRWSGTSWKAIATVSANHTSVTDANLSAGTAYAYRVAAVGKNRTISKFAYLWNASTDAVVVGNPNNDVTVATGLAATSLTKSDIIVQFTDNATNESGYHVQVSDNSAAWVTAGNVNGTPDTGTRVFDFANALASHTYQFRVVGYATGHDSVASAAVEALLPNPLAGPIASSTTPNIYNPPDHPIVGPFSTITTGGTTTTLADGRTIQDSSGYATFGNSAGSWGAAFTIKDTTGQTVDSISLGKTQTGYMVTPAFQYSLYNDGRAVVSQNFTAYGNSGNKVVQYASLTYNATVAIFDGPMPVTAFSALPGGLAAGVFGKYIGFTGFAGADPTGLSAPTSVTRTKTNTGVHLDIADVGTNETALLITRANYYDFASEVIVGVIPVNGSASTVQFNDSNIPSGIDPFYRVYPVNGNLIGNFTGSK